MTASLLLGNNKVTENMSFLSGKTHMTGQKLLKARK